MIFSDASSLTAAANKGLAQAGHDVVTSAFVHIQQRLGRDRLLIKFSCNFKLTNSNGLTGQADGILIPRLTPSPGRWPQAIERVRSCKSIMKFIFTYITILFSLFGKSQVGKLDIKITLTNTDTTSQYFVDTWVLNGNSTVSRIGIKGNGLHHLGDFKVGVYNLELYDYKTRRMKIDSVKINADSVTTLNIIYPALCKFIYPENYKPLCPQGHNDEVVKILYGYPTKKAMKEAEKGLIYLGGCIISDCDPKYYCKKHKIQF